MSSVEELFEAMRAWPEVEAIALGGSRATGNADEKSDYDVYLYVTAPVPTQRREKLLSDYCSRMEIDNNFWENEDNCTLNDGTDIDILYRDLDSFMNGVITSTIVFDRNGRFAAAQRRFSVPFPEPLRRNIIERNTRLLHGNLPSYDAQIRKAAIRGDEVAVNHRVAAFMESYFDVLFALNRLTHPGEKRLEKLASRNCAILPKDFEANLDTLFGTMFTDVDQLSGTLQIIVDNLQRSVDTNL